MDSVGHEVVSEKFGQTSLVYDGIPEVFINKNEHISSEFRPDGLLGFRYSRIPQPTYFSGPDIQMRPSGMYARSDAPSIHDLNADMLLTINYMMDLLVYQQSLLGPYCMVPPPPPPPAPMNGTFTSDATQTELLSGDIDGMGDRLLLYRSRIRTLEESIREYQNELNRLSATIRSNNRESSRLERCVAELRRENNRLKEYSNLKDTKLYECNKLIDYYKDELKNVTPL